MRQTITRTAFAVVPAAIVLAIVLLTGCTQVFTLPTHASQPSHTASQPTAIAINVSYICPMDYASLDGCAVNDAPAIYTHGVCTPASRAPIVVNQPTATDDSGKPLAGYKPIAYVTAFFTCTPSPVTGLRLTTTYTCPRGTLAEDTAILDCTLWTIRDVRTGQYLSYSASDVQYCEVTSTTVVTPSGIPGEDTETSNVQC